MLGPGCVSAWLFYATLFHLRSASFLGNTSGGLLLNTDNFYVELLIYSFSSTILLRILKFQFFYNFNWFALIAVLVFVWCFVRLLLYWQSFFIEGKYISKLMCFHNDFLMEHTIKWLWDWYNFVAIWFRHKEWLKKSYYSKFTISWRSPMKVTIHVVFLEFLP